MHRLAILTLVLAALLSPACAVSGGQKPGRSGARPGGTSSLIELNTATLAQLQTLPGITSMYARKIIANRPYKVKHELETRKILPVAVYSRIRDKVIATER